MTCGSRSPTYSEKLFSGSAGACGRTVTVGGSGGAGGGGGTGVLGSESSAAIFLAVQELQLREEREIEGRERDRDLSVCYNGEGGV